MDVLLLETPEDRRALAAGLGAAGCRVVRVPDARALGDALRRRPPDLLVLAAGRAEPALVEQVGALGRLHERPVVVFVDQTDAAAIGAALRAGVAGYVVRGAQHDRLGDVLAVARARFSEERALRRELDEARVWMEDRKLIERAKGRLMKRERLDEQEAYDVLRRLAMRRNCRIVDVARALLDQEAPG